MKSFYLAVSVAVGLITLPVSLRTPAQELKAPQGPDAVRPAEGSVLKLRVLGKGSQIYQCLSANDQPGHFEWKFQAPDAQLIDTAGKVVGKHYAGPTWESTDGSLVVGEVKARYAGPDAAAIPWLLLSAKSNTGHGVLTDIQSIQRTQTNGGAAPSENCSSANANQIVRIPYTATYSFYSAK